MRYLQTALPLAPDHNRRDFRLHTPVNIETSWPDAIYAQFRRVGIRQVGYVPDAGHSRLIALCRDDPDIADVVLTTEEEGVGLVAGAALGGQRAALLMQSSGVGNCINMFSLLRNCGFGCVVLVTMRGEFGEFNPWQVPMGAITEDVLRLSRLSHLSRSTAPTPSTRSSAPAATWRSTAISRSRCSCRSG